jgi:hypothetical protein
VEHRFCSGQQAREGVLGYSRPVLVCPGCGGRNLATAITCTFCERVLVHKHRRWWSARGLAWRRLAALALIVLMFAVIALGTRATGGP